MVDREFEGQLREVRDGSKSFDAFARETRRTWERLAEYVAGRWRLPRWASTADILQELLAGAWRAIWEYDPKRAKGATFPGYVIWNAVDAAKKQVHRWRGAKLHREADRNPSRMDFSYGQVWGDNADRVVEERLAQGPEQEQAIERREASERALKAARTVREQHAIRVLADSGSLAEGAMRLYADPTARRECRLSNEREAVRVVVDAAYAVAGRLEEAAA